jgi:hypothetical protein
VVLAPRAARGKRTSTVYGPRHTPWTFARRAAARDRTPSPHCPARDPRRAQAETAYAASAFFEDDDFSDFVDESDEEDESLFVSFDSFFSPLSFDRSISRLRRFVP